MALPSTGSLSMSQVNTELGRNSTQTISLGEGVVRGLAQRPTGSISFQDLRGKSAAAPMPEVIPLRTFFLTASENSKDVPLTGLGGSSVTFHQQDHIIWYIRVAQPKNTSVSLPGWDFPNLQLNVFRAVDAAFESRNHNLVNSSSRVYASVHTMLYRLLMSQSTTNITATISKSVSNATVIVNPILVKRRTDGVPSALSYIRSSDRINNGNNVTALTIWGHSFSPAPANSVSFVYIGRHAQESPVVTSFPSFTTTNNNQNYSSMQGSFGLLNNVTQIFRANNTSQVFVPDLNFQNLVTPNGGVSGFMDTISFIQP